VQSGLPQPHPRRSRTTPELRSGVGGGGGGGEEKEEEEKGPGGGVGAHTTGLIPLSGGLRPSLPARR